MRLWALLVEIEERKCFSISGGGAECAHVTDAMCGKKW